MNNNPGSELASLNFANLIGGPLTAVIEAQTMAARASVDFIKSVGFDEDNNPIYVKFKYPKEVAPYVPAVSTQISSVTIIDGGSYTAAPMAKWTQGSTIAMTSTTIDANGKVDAIALPTVRFAESPAPSISFVSAPVSNQTTAATATVTMSAPIAAIPAAYQDMIMEIPILVLMAPPFIRVEEATIDFNAKITSIETQSDSTEMGFAASLEVQQRWAGGRAKLNAAFSYQRKSSSGSSVEKTYSMNIHVRAVQDEMPAGMEKMLSILEEAMRATPAPALPE